MSLWPLNRMTRTTDDVDKRINLSTAKRSGEAPIARISELSTTNETQWRSANYADKRILSKINLGLLQ